MHARAENLLPINRRVAIAPMMDCTDTHCRYLLRLISPHALLYTEMMTTGALMHGARERLLAFNVEEHPVALQLGGSVPGELARCARYGLEYGYDEINLNVGCPSDRVQNARFGACLMAEPQLVADCVAAMREAVPIPVTVKTRLGIDDRDSYEHLCDFIATVGGAGCKVFILHARKAWLSGLSPKENREMPPLRYAWVHQIKRDFPVLSIILNGGIATVPHIQEQLAHVDGVMIGREAYHNPYLLADLEREVFDTGHVPGREQVVARYKHYIVAQLDRGVPLRQMTRHILGLFNGLPGARRWRRQLSERSHADCAGADILDAALRDVKDKPPAWIARSGIQSAPAHAANTP
ncbi:MAG: tRNA dihydrouridine(20/20a) synthase DusA [Chromatiales bacterium]